MIDKMMKERVVCGLDIGAQRIKACVLKGKDVGDLKLIGAYEAKTFGFKDASVSDLGELAECIQTTINKLVKKTGIKFKEVHIGLNGEMIDVRDATTTIPLIDRGSKVIVSRDIQAVNKQARLLGIDIEEEVLHDLPQHYKVDDHNSAINPVGLYGRKLGVQSLMVIANGNRVRNLTKAVNQAGYDIGQMAFSSYVSSNVILTKEDKEEGCVLIDIGSTTTNILVFKDGVLKKYHKIYLAGNNFTKEIVQKFSLPFDLAEEIKKSYASVLVSEKQNDEEILVKRENNYIPIKRGLIYDAIDPVVKLLVSNIRSIILGSGIYDQLNRGVFLIGGGALLPGLIEEIGKETNLPAQLGKIQIPVDKKVGNAAMFSSVIGLAQNGFRPSLHHQIASNGSSHWMKRIGRRFNELYQEYF